MNVFNSLAPIFLIIGLGALLSRIGCLTPPLVAGANAFAYWIALPALLFRETATAQVNLAGHWDAFAVLLGGMLVCVAAGYLAASSACRGRMPARWSRRRFAAIWLTSAWRS